MLLGHATDCTAMVLNKQQGCLARVVQQLWPLQYTCRMQGTRPYTSLVCALHQIAGQSPEACVPGCRL